MGTGWYQPTLSLTLCGHALLSTRFLQSNLALALYCRFTGPLRVSCRGTPRKIELSESRPYYGYRFQYSRTPEFLCPVLGAAKS